LSRRPVWPPNDSIHRAADGVSNQLHDIESAAPVQDVRLLSEAGDERELTK